MIIRTKLKGGGDLSSTSKLGLLRTNQTSSKLNVILYLPKSV